MLYYLILNGQPVGPVEAAQLPSMGINGETMVWREGMADWAKASTLPELAKILPPVPPKPPVNPYTQETSTYYTPYQAPQQPQPPYQAQQQTYYQQSDYVHTSKVGSAVAVFILSFLFGGLFSMIPAIVAWVKASNANAFYAAGNYDEAARKNASAGNWLTAAWVIWIFVTIIVVIAIAAAN